VMFDVQTSTLRITIYYQLNYVPKDINNKHLNLKQQLSTYVFFLS